MGVETNSFEFLLYKILFVTDNSYQMCYVNTVLNVICCLEQKNKSSFRKTHDTSYVRVNSRTFGSSTSFVDKRFSNLFSMHTLFKY